MLAGFFHGRRTGLLGALNANTMTWCGSRRTMWDCCPPNAAMSNPRTARNPVEGFVRPGLLLRCNKSIRPICTYTENLPLFW